jgi:hypothetical protein
MPRLGVVVGESILAVRVSQIEASYTCKKDENNVIERWTYDPFTSNSRVVDYSN